MEIMKKIGKQIATLLRAVIKKNNASNFRHREKSMTLKKVGTT
jgi:hypothetical protein